MNAMKMAIEGFVVSNIGVNSITLGVIGGDADAEYLMLRSKEHEMFVFSEAS
jgi:hypothetical protein